MASVGMNDRLPDLRYVQRIYGQTTLSNGGGGYHAGLADQRPPQDRELILTTEYTQIDSLLTSDESQEDDSNVYLQRFYSMVQEIQECIALISQKNKEICQVQKLITSKPASAVSEHTRRHAQLVEDVKKCSKNAFVKLQKINEEIKNNEQFIKGNPAIMRIKKAQFASLSYQLKQAMLEFNGHEDSYRDKCKNIIRRQVHAVQPGQEVSDETVDEIVDTNCALLPNSAVVKRMQCLDEVEARKVEILALERNVMELHDMFYQMMVLVEEQGDLIDHIETVVSQAVVYTEEGTDQIKKALQYKDSSRKLRVCLCLTLALTIFVVTVILVAVLTAVCKIMPKLCNLSK